jgi:AcrR family transcriptional regulator
MPDAEDLASEIREAEAERLSARGQRKCDQVMEGAREVFMAMGFGGASVDEIARRAGISKATMYRYFPDKTAIFNAYIRRECKRQAAHLLSIAPDDRPLEEVLVRLARGFITFVLSPFAQGIYRIAVAEAERFPDIGKAFFESGPDEARRRLAPVLAAAMERGELAQEDPDVAAFQFFELCKAKLFYRSLFCRECDVTEAAIDGQARLAVKTFLKAYAPT